MLVSIDDGGARLPRGVSHGMKATLGFGLAMPCLPGSVTMMEIMHISAYECACRLRAANQVMGDTGSVNELSCPVLPYTCAPGGTLVPAGTTAPVCTCAKSHTLAPG